MTPLTLEIYLSTEDRWKKIAELKPGFSASFSDNKPDGRRDVYVVYCLPDDSRSIIYRSILGIDTEIGDMRLLRTVGLKAVKKLEKGEAYEMVVKTDKSPEPRKIRLKHV